MKTAHFANRIWENQEDEIVIHVPLFISPSPSPSRVLAFSEFFEKKLCRFRHSRSQQWGDLDVFSWEILEGI